MRRRRPQAPAARAAAPPGMHPRRRSRRPPPAPRRRAPHRRPVRRWTLAPAPPRPRPGTCQCSKHLQTPVRPAPRAQANEAHTTRQHLQHPMLGQMHSPHGQPPTRLGVQEALFTHLNRRPDITRPLLGVHVQAAGAAGSCAPRGQAVGELARGGRAPSGQQQQRHVAQQRGLLRVGHARLQRRRQARLPRLFDMGLSHIYCPLSKSILPLQSRCAGATSPACEAPWGDNRDMLSDPSFLCTLADPNCAAHRSLQGLQGAMIFNHQGSVRQLARAHTELATTQLFM